MILLKADSNSIGLSGAQGSAFLGVPHSAVCGIMNGLRNTRVLIPGTCKCYLYGKGSSQVRSWMGKSILDYPGGALTVITDILVKGRQREI